MTGRIGPRNPPPQGHARPAKNDSEAGPSGTATPKSGPKQAATRMDSGRQAARQVAAGKGQRTPLEPISEEGSQTGASQASRHSGPSSNGSTTQVMDEILGKLGGSWKEIQRDLSMHKDYERACDRNPFIRSHLDPDLPSPRAGKPKDNWLQRPGLDLAGGAPPREGAGA